MHKDKPPFTLRRAFLQTPFYKHYALGGLVICIVLAFQFYLDVSLFNRASPTGKNKWDANGSGLRDDASSADFLEQIVRAVAEETTLTTDQVISAVAGRGIVDKTVSDIVEERLAEDVNSSDIEDNVVPLNANDKSEIYNGLSPKQHFETGQWFQPGVKYFVFQQSGGLSNQRIILETALYICKLLERTCVVPMAAPHTSMWWNFNKVDPMDLVSMGTVLDNEAMSKVAPVVILEGVSLKRFVAKNENQFGTKWKRVKRNNLKVKRKNQWTSAQIIDLYGSNTDDVLFFAEGTMWQSFKFTENEMIPVENQVRLHPELRQVGRLASEQVAMGKPYTSLHIRFQDFDGTNQREGWLQPAQSFTYRMKRYGFNDVSNIVYVATEPRHRKNPFFNGIRNKGYKLVFSHHLYSKHIQPYLAKTFPEKMHETILGLIEQLICVRSGKFLGTGFSTFSWYIRRMRRSRVLSYDRNLVSVSMNADGNMEAVTPGPGLQSASPEFLAEKEFLLLDTPCDKLTIPC